MVHEKFIEVNGKRYGPYFYESYRENGKVKKRYVKGQPLVFPLGNEKISRRVKNGFAFIAVLLIAIFGLFFLVDHGFTGRAILEIDANYSAGEIVGGKVDLNLKEGELIPADSVVRVSLNEQSREILISGLVLSEKTSGRFFIEGSEVVGEGEGYGLAGTREIFPDVDFKLKVISSKEENENGQGDTVIPDEVVGEDTKEDIVENNGEVVGNNEGEVNGGVGADKDVENEIVAEENLKEDESVSEGNSDSVDEPAPSITGSAVSLGEKIIDGSASKDNDFVYELSEGESAELVEGSVKVGGEEIGDGEISLSVSDGFAKVSTSYSTSESGFGEEFLGEGEISLEVELSQFGVSAEDGMFKVEIVYGNDSLVSAQEDIVLGAVNESEIVPENVTGILNESNITIVPLNLSFVKNIGVIRIAKGGSASLDLEEYFVGAESYVFIGENISAAFDGGFVVLSVDEGFSGARKGIFVASAGEQSVSSNEFTILVSSGAVNIKTSRERIEIGKSVKWRKDVSLETPERVIVELPSEAENISVRKVEKEGEFDLTEDVVFSYGESERFSGFVTARVVDVGEENKNIEVVLDENATDYIIEYETPAPEVREVETSRGKIVTISASDDLNYTDVIAFTEVANRVSLENAGSIRIYWKNADSLVVKMVEEVEEEVVVEEIDSSAIEDVIEEDVFVNENNLSGYENISFDLENKKRSSIFVFGAFWKRINWITGNVIAEIKITEDEDIFSELGDEYKMQEMPFDAYDLDGDGNVDYLEWVVPHLSDQTFEIILIIKAEHLDENKTFISDIYDEVKALDGNWSEPIYNNEYVRVTFEKNLTKEKDITVYARASCEGNSTVVVDGREVPCEIYEKKRRIDEIRRELNGGYSKT